MRRPLLGFGSELELPRLPPESLHLEEADVEVPHGAGVVEELQWHVKAEPARGRSNLWGVLPRALQMGLTVTVTHRAPVRCEAYRKRQLCGNPR